MGLQYAGEVDAPSASTARFYVPADVATDAAFPFTAGDPFVLRTARHEAVVLTTPECTASTLDLPPIDDNLL
jgi:hypothetical protein